MNRSSTRISNRTSINLGTQIINQTRPMRFPIFVAITAITLQTSAQYGSFDAKAVATAKANTTLVVLDDGNTSYNTAIMNAVKAEWKFTKSFDFINTADLATQPIDPTKNYLMKILRRDAEKHDAVFLALIQGWKQKKGEAIEVTDGAAANIPGTQEIASLMIDAKAVGSSNSAMLLPYVKHLQDFLKNVESGKMKDKATADRLYASRTRLIKDMDLWLAQEHLDKTIPDAAKAKETYTKQLQVMDLAQLMAAAEKGESGVAISDVVMTGDHKTKWCFKRIFNASTGELLYLRDDASLFDKKQGFISEDVRMLEQAR